MTVHLPVALPLLVVLLLAAREDLRTRRIPNVLVVVGLMLALATRTFLEGGPGAISVVTGMLLAGGLLLPAWLLGWTGAGDVKLMAVVGAWLGVSHGAMAVFLSMLAGGCIALVVALRHRMLKQTVLGAATLGTWVLSGTAGSAPAPRTGLRYPFAVAALVGGFVALWVPA